MDETLLDFPAATVRKLYTDRSANGRWSGRAPWRYGKLLLGKSAATTVMTGNVTQLVIDLVDAARGDADAMGRCKKLAWPVLAFALGCMGGALMFVAVGFHGLLLPCVLLLWLAIAAQD